VVSRRLPEVRHGRYLAGRGTGRRHQPDPAQQIFTFAKSKGMNTLSMWAIECDNSGCPGNGGANNCSGIVQNTWDFTHILAPYTGP